jgi:branched-chain amino acid transport system permease protein
MASNKNREILIKTGWTALKVALVAVVVIVFTSKANNYYFTIVNSALIYVIAALSLSLLLGMGGMMSFATVTFMGIGAYATANLSKVLHVPTSLSILLAVLISALIAFLIAILLTRLKGSYFAFASIGLAQISYAIFLNFKPLTGGPNGFSNVPKLIIAGIEFDNLKKWFYLLLIIVFLAALSLERIRRTTLGRSLAAIRDNEIAAQSLGIDIYSTKIITFVIASVYGSIAGALIAHMNTYLSAYLFTFDISVSFLIMVMLGGVNSTTGAILGALLVTLIPEWFRVLQSYMKLIYGISIVALMIFMPSGLTGIIDSIKYKVDMEKKKKRNKDYSNG